MFLNGDLLSDQEYVKFFDQIFQENVKVTQDILKIINKVPSKRLRTLLIRVLRSNFGTQCVARIAAKHLAA